MRLLIVDPQGNGLDFALRAQRSGHDVRLAIRQTEKTKYIGRGLVSIVEYKDWIRWADLVVCTDNTRYTYDLDQRWLPAGSVKPDRFLPTSAGLNGCISMTGCESLTDR